MRSISSGPRVTRALPTQTIFALHCARGTAHPFDFVEVAQMPSKKPSPAGQVGFYVEHFTRAELADLDRALNDSLGGEIGMLRVVMRRFFERAAQEADDLKALAEALRVLGMSCARLARLVTTERNLQDKRADEVGEALSQSLAAVLEELNQSGLGGNGKGDGDG